MPAIFQTVVLFSLLILSSLEKGIYGQNCTTQLLNQVVYEGAANTKLTCNSPSPVAWSVTPTNDELFTHKITNNSNTVDPSLTGFYDVTNTNLNIKTATLSPSKQPPITTAGLYVAQYSSYGSNNKIGAKLVVVRPPITCSCTTVNSTTNRMTCNVTYADFSYNPIYPKVAWKSDNTVKSTATLTLRNKVNGTYTSTATTFTSVNDPPYLCNLSFSKPMSVAIPYIATNYPTFWDTCTPNCVYDDTCTMPPQNQVVYEGDANTIMTCNSGTPVAWSINPTNDELFAHRITNNSNAVDPSLTGFYDVTNTNLNIKTATLSPSTPPPITTAGMYVAQYSPSGTNNKFGAKLVVVQRPITCNCTAFNSTTNRMACTVRYADSSYNPIYAKVAWKANSTVKSIATLSVRTNTNSVYTSTSTIFANVSDAATYSCNVSFTSPMSVTVPYIATNIPTFWDTCIPNYCG